MDQALLLEKIPFQELNGKLKNWATFKRVFKEMIKQSAQGPVLEMVRLTSAIPKELEAFMEREEARKKLEERYGGRNFTIIAAIRNLTRLEIPAGLTHEKVEVLVQSIRVAKARLRAVGGESELFADSTTVSTLVEKVEQES